MIEEVVSTSATNLENHLIFEIELPTTCPHCSKGIIPKHIGTFHIRSINVKIPTIYSNFMCPNCNRIFIAVYFTYITDGVHHVEKMFPAISNKKIDKKSFSENISNMSPSFVKIYNESFLAEQQGLSEICGMGYRKALEFLIKDFAIKQNPLNENEIKNKQLSPCINEYIENNKIKTLATASAWLGNDETHYCRKHEDYNVNHLKAFINAIVSYIDSELNVEIAEHLIDQVKSSK